MFVSYLGSESYFQNLGQEMKDLISELYPICRSITGNGVRQSLAALKKYIPLDIHEVPTGTKVFDWVIPKEWNIRDDIERLMAEEAKESGCSRRSSFLSLSDQLLLVFFLDVYKALKDPTSTSNKMYFFEKQFKKLF